jgi:hypothetical protein
MTEDPPTPKPQAPPRTPPMPVGDDMETVKRFFLIAAVSIMTGLLFLAVCALVVAKRGG